MAVLIAVLDPSTSQIWEGGSTPPVCPLEVSHSAIQFMLTCAIYADVITFCRKHDSQNARSS